MKFALSPEREQFAASIRALLSDSGTPAVARAWAAGDHAPGLAVWRELAATGVTTLATEAEPVDVVIAMEAIGYHALPGPAVETLAVLPGRTGDALGTVAYPPHVPHAVDADVAQPFVVTDGTVFTGTVGEAVSSIDPARRLFTVSPGEPVGSVDAVAFELGVLACAAQLLGAGCALLDRTVAYAKTRRQFGQPVGGFQAVKHHLASVYVDLEFARPLLYGAALSLSPAEVSAAKVAAGEAAYRAARCALQVHGAIGYTAEYDLGLWLTKVRALRSAWGTPSTHRTRISREWL